MLDCTSDLVGLGWGPVVERGSHLVEVGRRPLRSRCAWIALTVDVPLSKAPCLLSEKEKIGDIWPERTLATELSHTSPFLSFT
jgi:hypothetical protein